MTVNIRDFIIDPEEEAESTDIFAPTGSKPKTIKDNDGCITTETKNDAPVRYKAIEHDFFNLKIVRIQGKSKRILELHSDKPYFHIRTSGHDYDMLTKCNRRAFESFVRDIDSDAWLNMTKNGWYSLFINTSSLISEICEALNNENSMKWLNAGLDLNQVRWGLGGIEDIDPRILRMTHKAALARSKCHDDFDGISLHEIDLFMQIESYVDDIQPLIEQIEKDSFADIEKFQQKLNRRSPNRFKYKPDTNLNIHEWMNYIEQSARGQALNAESDSWLIRNADAILMWLNIMEMQMHCIGRIIETYPQNLESTNTRFDNIESMSENNRLTAYRTKLKPESDRFEIESNPNICETLMRMHIAASSEQWGSVAIASFKDKSDDKNDALLLIEDNLVIITGFEGRRPTSEMIDYIESWRKANGIGPQN